MKDSDKENLEKEVDELLIFVGDFITSIDLEKSKKLKDVAELWGVAQENLTRYKNYSESTKDGGRHDPHLRTFYKIVRGVLGHPPIPHKDPLDLKFHKFKEAQKTDQYGIINKILAMITSDIDLEPLSAVVDIYYNRLNIPPRKTGESDKI